jgi:cbb3-type cytochrome oxidase subunit 3
MWEEVLFVLIILFIIIILFAFGLKIKNRELRDLEKYFRSRHG